ncbi:MULTISPECIES: hypothetical protein [unclassified Rhodococcus (in: high G+C Gram-positive bacteria)]|uniref:hypothetical protein n=1 Tax=unclassified Rhodococcus (in: high G+C Gram-positive bacteria) TaxID=192944 RepID=UPI000A025742|nr:MULTISPECIES: hypothetical protein [unclassified Rhodococcus (in: high G+C Gram-positive bacteria)]
MSPDIFQQRDRWLEELREYVRSDTQIICEAGYMSLPAITEEILQAAHDPRPHDGQQKNDWESRALDLEDALTWLGPELDALVNTAVSDLHTCITADLLAVKKGRAVVDDTKRPAVAQNAASLAALLDRDEVLVAAWRDLIAACKNMDHETFSTEQVKYLRDNVFALCGRRRQDPGAFGPLQTAYGVLLGFDHSVRRAKSILGDELGPPEPDVNSASPLNSDELERLSERSIVALSPTGDFVIWFRIASAFVKGGACVSHGAVTFYTATSLAGALTDHDAARELYDVVPEELLIDQIREFQVSDDGPNEHRGFEYRPALVYARVVVQAIERHLARSRARTLLDAVLKVNGTPDNLWRVLRGSLMFGDGVRYFGHSISWGPKEEFVSRELDYENDHFTTTLTQLNDQGATVTADAAEALLPVLQLQDELRSAPDANPEAVVRAAVRAIEHCNTWTERGQLSWTGYLSKYLLDFYTVETFAFRAVAGVFMAAVAHIPDHTPDAPNVPELADIADDIRGNKWDGPIIRAKTVAHTAILRRVYQDHWLARSLAELDDTLASAGALSVAFEAEKARVAACTARLRRTRNAAIHGGPISPVACETISSFARRIAGLAITNVIEAVIDGAEVDVHTLHRRSRYQKRVENLTLSGDLENLFDLSPPPASALAP